MSPFTITAKDFRVILRDRRDHAIETAEALQVEARKWGEPRKDDRGAIVVTEGTHLLRTARKWLLDAFDCEMLICLTDDDAPPLQLSRDRGRWLYKHIAPADIHPDIGEWPAGDL